MMSFENLGLLAVFAEGLLSFLSPCVLPLIPLYLSYLSSGAKTVKENGEIEYQNKKVLYTTFCFVLGISLTFFILAISVDWLKNYIQEYQNIIGLIGGVIVTIFALSQLGLFTISFNSLHLPFKINTEKVGGLKAFGLGFIFSFAWTPCVGPMLANVILLAVSENALLGNLYIAVYALGFILPFLLLALFTKKALDFIKRKDFTKYTMKIAGVIMLVFGLSMIYQNSNSIISETAKPQDSQYLYLSEYKFYDQDGNVYNLADYEGEYVFINFVTTWCTYCRQEIPSFEQFLKDNNLKGFYIMSPMVNKGSIEDIKKFHQDNNMTTTILVDESAILFQKLGVNSFPKLAVIGPDGSFIGYADGLLQIEQLNDIYKKAQEMYESR